MEFSHTIIYVQNVEKTMRFYVEAFGFEGIFVHESGLYGELETGGTKLAFAGESMAEANFTVPIVPNRPKSDPAGMELVFTVDNVSDAYETAVSKGAAPLSEPVQKPWGQVVAYVRDINGVLIELASRM